METLTLKQIAEFASARLLQGDAELGVNSLCIDSRKLESGALFVAIAGERFDGHDFVEQSAALGAAGAIVHRLPTGDLPPSFAVLQVEDTLLAFQKIATRYRAERNIRAIGITGSNGKTSTKDQVAAVLGRRFCVLKTEGNFNNHLGVPITMLRLERQHEVAVLEMGMNHPGEIAPLAAMAAPEVAIITNVGVAHIEFMGSREAIGLEKGMLAEAIPQHGLVILNGDDDMSDSIAARCKAKVIRTGIHQGDVRAEAIVQTLEGSRFQLVHGLERVEASLKNPGLHMVSNALLAVAAGLHFGLSLEECAEGLAGANLTKGRLQQKRIAGLDILDDSYNANPDSMVAALSTMSQIAANGRRFAVLGRMGELGPEAERGHRRVGEAAAQQQIDCLIAVGNEAHWIAESAASGGVAETHHVENVEQAAALLKQLANPGDLILVKGSRSSAMERVLEKLSTMEEMEAAV